MRKLRVHNIINIAQDTQKVRILDTFQGGIISGKWYEDHILEYCDNNRLREMIVMNSNKNLLEVVVK